MIVDAGAEIGSEPVVDGTVDSQVKITSCAEHDYSYLLLV